MALSSYIIYDHSTSFGYHLVLGEKASASLVDLFWVIANCVRYFIYDASYN